MEKHLGNIIHRKPKTLSRSFFQMLTTCASQGSSFKSPLPSDLTDDPDCASTASCVSFPSCASFSPCRRRGVSLFCAFSRGCLQAARSLTNLEWCCCHICASCLSFYASLLALRWGCDTFREAKMKAKGETILEGKLFKLLQVHSGAVGSQRVERLRVEPTLFRQSEVCRWHFLASCYPAKVNKSK